MGEVRAVLKKMKRHVDLEKAFDRVPREVISWAMLSWELKNGLYRQ